jgi:hypothetical protein
MRSVVDRNVVMRPITVFRYDRDKMSLVQSQTSMNIMYGKLKSQPVTSLEYHKARDALKYSSTLSITSVLNGEELSAPRPGRFIPEIR